MKVTFEQLKAAFNRVLISRGVDSETADACAEMFARTTESGVYSHGVNRFPRFIQQLENGDIIPDAQPHDGNHYDICSKYNRNGRNI